MVERFLAKGTVALMSTMRREAISITTKMHTTVKKTVNWVRKSMAKARWCAAPRPGSTAVPASSS